MKTMYAKTMLYFYSGLEDIISELQRVIEDKALSSMSDYSSALKQCEDILQLTYDKQDLIELGKVIKSTLKLMKPSDLVVLDYNYIRKMDESEYLKHDLKSRNYFRKKKVIVQKFASLLEEFNLNDETFEKKYLTIKTLKNFYRGVCGYEDSKTNSSKKTNSQNSDEEQKIA